MKNIKLSTSIQGNYIEQKNRYTYKDELIICKRKGSIIEVKDNVINIHADVTGVDKVYFEIKDNKITISNIFKDFLNNKLNKEFMEFQESKGFVPYPFTILKNVMKAPPGLITKIYFSENQIKYEYYSSKELEIFNTNKNFNKKLFREKFTRLLLENAKKQKELVSSFSGGFDSTFLTSIYVEKCKRLLHFSEEKQINVSMYKNIFPRCKWTIIDNYEDFSDKDKTKYFKSIDEPCCDSAGFAEYLMIKKLKKEKDKSKTIIMNGQACDGIFTNGRIYFQEFISSKTPDYVRNIISGNNYDNKILSKMQNYSMETKKRFLKEYIGNFQLSEAIKDEIIRIYNIYEKTIKNDSTNTFAACIFMLKYSLHGVEKIRTVAHAFNTKYYLPFMSENIITFAFSIPAKYKIGYSHGKKILVEAYPEISKMTFATGAFLPKKLEERFIKTKLTDHKYNSFYIKNWINNNLKNEQ